MNASDYDRINDRLEEAKAIISALAEAEASPCSALPEGASWRLLEVAIRLMEEAQRTVCEATNVDSGD